MSNTRCNSMVLAALVSVVLLVSVAALPTQGAELTLTASAEASLLSQETSDNVGWILYFELPESLEGARIDRATLNVAKATAEGGATLFRVLPVAGGWNMVTTTVSDAETSVVDSVVCVSFGRDEGETAVLDVTALVAGWADGSIANLGLMIEGLAVGDGYEAAIIDGEALEVDQPSITIKYTPEPRAQ